MAPVLPELDDFVIVDRSNADTHGQWVTVFAVTGPNVEGVGEQFHNLEAAKAIRQSEGKRLKYRESIDNPPYAPVVEGQADGPFQE